MVIIKLDEVRYAPLAIALAPNNDLISTIHFGDIQRIVGPLKKTIRRIMIRKNTDSTA